MAREIQQTPVFEHWLTGLKDAVSRAIIVRRIERAAAGNLGDVRPVGDGVNELRIDYGPGFRVYFVRRGETLIVLLCGGDKASQPRDIARAKTLAQEV
jgi:putative addiction module killer protein